MVREAVGNDHKLQVELLVMLVNANDEKEGLYWAKQYKVPKEEWPWAILHEEEYNSESNVLIYIFIFLNLVEYL